MPWKSMTSNQPLSFSTFLLALFQKPGGSSCLVTLVLVSEAVSYHIIATSSGCRKNCVLICFTGSAPPSSASDHLSVTSQPSILFRRRWRLPDQIDSESYLHKLQVSVPQIDMVFDRFKPEPRCRPSVHSGSGSIYSSSLITSPTLLRMDR